MRQEENCLLALSGGGYRAMLFHVGALLRLNELGELSKLTHISSVSGGSIVAGVVAANWSELKFDDEGIAQNFRPQVVERLIRLASHTIDVPSVLVGFLPFSSAARNLELCYRRHLFGNKTLAELPSVPRFFFNATNFQTGAIWTFRKEAMGDPTLGDVSSEGVSLARAVAASSAFPPFLAPIRMKLRDAKWEKYSALNPSLRAYDDLLTRTSKIPDDKIEKFRKFIVLADGGIADNLGLVTLWGTSGELFIGDGGGSTPPQARPWRDWLRQLIRTVALIHDQPSQLRSDRAKSEFADHDEKRLGNRGRSIRRDGAYWNMRWPPESHDDVTFAQLNEEVIVELASVPTRLKAMSSITKQRLINWGYVAANRSLPYLARLWWRGGASVFDERLPFPEASIYFAGN
jgi:NTE family protein